MNLHECRQLLSSSLPESTACGESGVGARAGAVRGEHDPHNPPAGELDAVAYNHLTAES